MNNNISGFRMVLILVNIIMFSYLMRNGLNLYLGALLTMLVMAFILFYTIK